MLRVEVFLLGHHHHRYVHRRRRSEAAAVASRMLEERAWHHHRHGHALREQIVLTRVHVLSLELMRHVLEVGTDHWRLLQCVMADLRRPVLHHVLVHREDHRITDRRDVALVREAHERRWEVCWHAQP